MANHAIGAMGQAVPGRSRNTAIVPTHDTEKGKIVTSCDEMKDVNASHEPSGAAAYPKRVAPATSSHAFMEEEERNLVLHFVRTWAGNPRLILHKVIGIVVRAGGILRHGTGLIFRIFFDIADGIFHLFDGFYRFVDILELHFKVYMDGFHQRQNL